MRLGDELYSNVFTSSRYSNAFHTRLETFHFLFLTLQWILKKIYCWKWLGDLYVRFGEPPQGKKEVPFQIIFKYTTTWMHALLLWIYFQFVKFRMKNLGIWCIKRMENCVNAPTLLWNKLRQRNCTWYAVALIANAV